MVKEMWKNNDPNQVSFTRPLQLLSGLIQDRRHHSEERERLQVRKGQTSLLWTLFISTKQSNNWTYTYSYSLYRLQYVNLVIHDNKSGTTDETDYDLLLW